MPTTELEHCDRLAGVTLLDDLDAFVQDHKRCGDLDSAVEGDRVWTTCFELVINLKTAQDLRADEITK
jgi:hypothetical protein